MNNFNRKIEQLLTESDILAIQALEKGVANDIQQQIALDAIVNKICRVAKSSFNEESSHITAFNEGVRYSGLQIFTALKIDLAKYRQLKQRNSQTKPNFINKK